MNYTNHLITTIALFLTMGLLSQKVNAQTSVDFYTPDSTQYLCPAPANGYFHVYGMTDGYNYLTDQMAIDIYYGDGAVESFLCPLLDGGGTSAWFNPGFYNHIYSLPGTYTATLIATGPDGNADTLTLDVFCSFACGNVNGYTYLDNNSNCVFDSGDSTLKHLPVKVFDGSGNFLTTGYTDTSGFYAFTLSPGTYTVVADVSIAGSGITPTCPGSASYTFVLAGTASNDFGFECATGFDLIANGTGWGITPGGLGWISVWGGNFGCMPTSGTLTLTLDPHVSFAGTIWGIPPSSSTASTITWNLTGLSISNSYLYYSYWDSFLSTLKIMSDTTLAIGDTVCFTVDITPVPGDLDPFNNTYSFCVPVVASFDPNMKVVSPAGIGLPGYVPEQSVLNYTVYFQNTGTATATDIYIVDTLDMNLDLATFEIIASSHPMTPSFSGSNIAIFDFENIFLPDSTTNEPASHGWVKYKAKAKSGLSDGTPIENTAYIFFDYNPAVITNTTLNTIQIPSGLTIAEKEKKNSLRIYPNPSSTNVNVILDESINATILVIDTTGKIVMTCPINGNSSTLNVEPLPSGIYQLVIPGTTTLNTRFQKVK